MKVASSPEINSWRTFVDQHPWLFILSLVAMVEIVIWPIRWLVQRMPLPDPIGTYLLEGLLIAIAFVCLSRLKWWREVGFLQGIPPRELLVCLFPTLIQLSITSSNLIPLITGSLHLGLGPLILLAIQTILIGVAEESLCRGLMLQALVTKGVIRAVVVSAVVFALLHSGHIFQGFSAEYVISQLVITFGWGIMFGTLRVRTGSIWLPIFLHSFTDYGALASTAAQQISKPDVASFATIVAATILCGLYIVYAAVALRPRKLAEVRARYQEQPQPEPVSA